MATTIPALTSVDDILDTDLVMVTHSNGQSYKIPGTALNKRNQVVISANTTLTGTPLKTGNVVRAYFTADLVANNSSTPLTLSYNSVSYTVKVPKNGALANYLPFDVGGGVYKYLQAYTTLELIFDGTYFVVLGNPVVLSSADYTIYPDGNGRTNVVAANNLQSVTSNAVAQRFRNTQFDLINHEIDYFSQTVQFDCNVYLNTNIEIVAPIAQFSNYPSQISQSGYSPLIGWLVSRGENIMHDYDLRNMRNIQEFTAIFFNGSGWQCSKYRRFAIDDTLFPWAFIN